MTQDDSIIMYIEIYMYVHVVKVGKIKFQYTSDILNTNFTEKGIEMCLKENTTIVGKSNYHNNSYCDFQLPMFARVLNFAEGSRQ